MLGGGPVLLVGGEQVEKRGKGIRGYGGVGVCFGDVLSGILWPILSKVVC
jgi:hypothetical protein